MSESSQHNDEEATTLRTEPSFCIYNADDDYDDKFGEKSAENMETIEEKLQRSATVGEIIEVEFSFVRNAMRLIEENDQEEEDERFRNLKIEIEAAGGDEVEPSKLKNYAQYLESTGDLLGAEEYYFQATKADPKDGEILSQYAKLVWQLHGDEDRASCYFEKAIEAAPQDSKVLATYASFLWDVDENEDEEHSYDTQGDENHIMVDASASDFKEEKRPPSPPLHLAMGLGISDAGFGNLNDVFDNTNRHSAESSNVEEHYRRMVDENPCNPLFLRNYALFLHQVKGDLEGAEEYYSRGIVEDPCNGQMLSLYAGIVWQLHHDKDRAVASFERAVEATPQDSDVLAAYAKFLWETEDVE